MAAAAQRKTNWFVVGVSIAVVAVLVVLGGVVVWLNAKASDAGPAPENNQVAVDGALVFGDGEDTVTVYIDFMCPICNTFEQQYGEQLQQAATDGKITLEYRPIAILDRFSQGTNYSSRSAGAVFCVAENAPDSTLEYMQALFTNQPDENTTGLPDETLVQFAEEAGAGAAATCIEEGTYKKYGEAQAKEKEIQGTPTVEINGKRLDLQAGELSEMEALIG